MSKAEQDAAYPSSQADPDEKPAVPGAEGGADSDSAHKLPGAPSDDDAPVGSTDQHSDA